MTKWSSLAKRCAGCLFGIGATMLLASAPVVANDKTPEALALEGLAKIISALELFGQSIPQYEAPEVLPNGDIIIRRKNPNPAKDEPLQEKPKDSI